MTFPTCSQCGSRNLAFEEEVVCRSCATVQREQTANTTSAISVEMQRALLSNNYHPVDELKILKIGSQHDMSTMATKGLAMELGDIRAKDYTGKRCKPTLSFGYVTGQVVGKGSRVEEKDQWDITLECGHQHTLDQQPSIGCMECQDCKVKFERPKLGLRVFSIDCFTFKYLIDSHHYKAPVAVKDFTDDTIFRNAMIAANDIASKLQLDNVARRYYGQVFRQEYSKFVNLADELLALKAVKKTAIEYKGFGLQVSEYNKKYNELIEAMRVFLFEVVQYEDEAMITTNS